MAAVIICGEAELNNERRRRPLRDKHGALQV